MNKLKVIYQNRILLPVLGVSILIVLLCSLQKFPQKERRIGFKVDGEVVNAIDFREYKKDDKELIIYTYFEENGKHQNDGDEIIFKGRMVILNRYARGELIEAMFITSH